MAGFELTNQTALEALERFVVDNDDLLQLEELIGRFNIFDALRIARTEIRHSNFLAWLLDPNESHGQGSLFLKAILMDLLKQTPAKMRPLSPVELDGEEMRGVQIRREFRHIDLLITCEEPAFAIAIENKIDSDEHSNQLQRYGQTISAEFPQFNGKRLFVFLTTLGSKASDKHWVSYSYRDIYSVLARVRRLSAGALGADVATFVDHYLQLLGNRFMDNKEIDDLCKRIYSKHRIALDLIFERATSTSRQVLDLIENELETNQDWTMLLRRRNWVSFTLSDFKSQLPAVGNWPDRDPRLWLVFAFECYEGECRLAGYVGPMIDETLRVRIVQKLVGDGNPFRFRLVPRSLKNRIADGRRLPEWTRILKAERLMAIPDDTDIEPDEVRKVLKTKLSDLRNRLAGLPSALQATIWEFFGPSCLSAQR